MARTVQDAQMGTRAARIRLKTGETVHWRALVPGQLHLGYRRRSPDVPGKWISRRYVGLDSKLDKNGNKIGRYIKQALGTADDFRDADGISVLSFGDAQRLAHANAEHAAASPTSDVTVRDVVMSYIASRDKREATRQGRVVRSDASQRLGRYVVGRTSDKPGARLAIPHSRLADLKLAKLTEADLRLWRSGLPGTLRATTVRRLSSDLRAALAAGYEARRGELPSDLLETIKFGLKAPATDGEDAEQSSRDDQILSDAEHARLLVAARRIDVDHGWDGDLWRMILVLAATGARFSQVARLLVRDFQADNGRLMVPVSRKGNRAKPKSITHVAIPIGTDVIEALRPVAVGRAADSPLLERWLLRQVAAARWERAGRGRWQGASALTRPFSLIRGLAALPTAIPYSLRHTSIVRDIRKNLPIRLVAGKHDTSVAIIEKHYSKFIVSGLEDMLRTAIVPLVPAETAGENVVSLDTRRMETGR